MELHRTSIVVLTILIGLFSIISIVNNCLAALAASLTGGCRRKGSIRVLEIFKKYFGVIGLNKPSEKWLATRKFGEHPIALQLSIFSLNRQKPMLINIFSFRYTTIKLMSKG
jgi:hypothetical protein